MVNPKHPQIQQNRGGTKTSGKIKEDVRNCGRWVLRQTKFRRDRAETLCITCKTPLSKGNIKKRKRYSPPHSSEAGSQGSFVGENPIPVETMADDLADIGMWGYSTTSTFINIMIDEVRKEGQSSSKMDRNFTSKQWNSIEVEMEKRLKRRGYTVKKLQGKLMRLKKSYRAFRDLKDNQTGLGWDPENETVTMTDEQWKLYIQAHPDARPFQKKGLDHYDLLAELLGNSMATGAFGHGNRQGAPTSDDEREMEDIMNRIRSGRTLASDGTDGSKGKRKSESEDWETKSIGRKGKAPRKKDAVWEQIAFCQKAKGQFYEIAQGKEKKGEGSESTTPECIRILNTMKANVDPLQFVKAFNQLALCSELRVAWLELDPVMREVWVNSLI